MSAAYGDDPETAEASLRGTCDTFEAGASTLKADGSTDAA